MNISNLENKQFQVLNPVEIDLAVNNLREQLSKLTFISHPFHIAQRFYKKDEKNGKTYYFPEIYIASGQDKDDRYIRLTPDNKLKGSFFFVVSTAKDNGDGFLIYNIGIVFSVNLELIDPVKYKNYLFTQELIGQARQVLKAAKHAVDFTFEVKEEVRDTREVFKEYTIDEVNANVFNRAPMQCFRFNITATIEIPC